MEDKENERVAKENKKLDEQHGSLNVVAVFDIIGIIATVIWIIVILIRTSPARHYDPSYNALIWGLIGFSVLSIIMCVFVRNALLQSKHKYAAVIINLIFAIGWPLEFVCAIIIGCSDLYKTEVVISGEVDNHNYQYYCDEIKKNHLRYTRGEINQLAYKDKFYELKKSLNEIRLQAQCSLAALNSIEQKCGLSSEQQEKKNELINVLDTSKKVLGYYDVNKVEMVDGEIISNKTQYYIEKSNDLPLEKKEIFNKHKKYLDNGVYSNIEFECKVAYLFEE